MPERPHGSGAGSTQFGITRSRRGSTPDPDTSRSPRNGDTAVQTGAAASSPAVGDCVPSAGLLTSVPWAVGTSAARGARAATAGAQAGSSPPR